MGHNSLIGLLCKVLHASQCMHVPRVFAPSRENPYLDLPTRQQPTHSCNSIKSSTCRVGKLTPSLASQRRLQTDGVGVDLECCAGEEEAVHLKCAVCGRTRWGHLRPQHPLAPLRSSHSCASGLHAPRLLIGARRMSHNRVLLVRAIGARQAGGAGPAPGCQAATARRPRRSPAAARTPPSWRPRRCCRRRRPESRP